MEEITNAVHIDETIYDGQSEQGVELDYILPDYYPDIFKLLSCSLTPKIVSYSVSGDLKLNIDGVVYIKVLYLTENSGAVHCIDQRYTYSKTVDISRNGVGGCQPIVTLVSKTDYCNCRAVSPRRIDVRGAVSVRIKAVCCMEYPLPDIPEELQVKTRSVKCCGKTLSAEKQLLLREEIDTGASGIAFILQCGAVPRITDLRVIADKAVLKGIVTVNALYGTADGDSGGSSNTEKMTAEIPISAILDVDGITDEHKSFPELSVMNFELVPKTDSGILSCELLVNCRVRAQLEEQTCVAADVYSTEYETSFTAGTLKVASDPKMIHDNLSVKVTMTTEKGEINSIWDASGELRGAVCRPSENGLTLTAQLFCTVYGTNTDGVPFYSEKQENIEERLPCPDLSENVSAELSAYVADTAFSIKPDGVIELTCSINVDAYLRNINAVEAVETVTVHEDKRKEKSDEYALRICYTDDNDGANDCWSIAKRYNTTVAALMEENDIESCDSPLSGMIVIPTV